MSIGDRRERERSLFTQGYNTRPCIHTYRHARELHISTSRWTAPFCCDMLITQTEEYDYGPHSKTLRSLSTTIFKGHREYKPGFWECFSRHLYSNLVHLSLEPYKHPWKLVSLKQEPFEIVELHSWSVSECGRVCVCVCVCETMTECLYGSLTGNVMSPVYQW